VSTVDALLVGWAVGLSLVTLGDWFWEGRQLDLIPLRNILAYVSQWDETTVPATQIVGNALLFLPVGLLAPARWPRFRRLLPTLGVAAVIAVTIELLQLASAQGRVTSTDDVLLAIVGAAAGWLAYRLIAAGASAVTTARTPSPASPGSPRS
jgi:glycopeptide antibiotics resistance protein